MEWIGSLIATLVLFLLVVPAAVAVGSVFLLGAASWEFYASPSVARAGFYCPFSKRWVTAAFLTQAGSEEPPDVVCCSRFGRVEPSPARKAARIWRRPAGRPRAWSRASVR